jgi:hypothetical protein
MSAINTSVSGRRVRRERGVYAVEFALVALIFFVFVFGTIELSRAMYLFNTLQEVTRRAAAAAAVSNPKDAAQRQHIREQAIFRDAPGELVVGTPITDQHVRIEYYALVANGSGSTSMQEIPYGSLSCPVNNRKICLADPNDPLCVRFVRARICNPSPTTSCDTTRVPYETVTSLVSFAIGLPHASTIVPAGSLGYTPNMQPCP